MKALMLKYKTMASYLVFGVLTTLLNMLVYFVCYEMCHISNLESTVAAWGISVIFAFATNKQYVFGHREWGLEAVLTEGIKFAGGRLGTGVLEVFLMYITVDVIGLPGLVMKAGANVLVIILNYVISKQWIFVVK